MFTIARCAFMGLMFGVTAAYAGDVPRDIVEGAMNACRADYHRVCPYVVPGDGRAARCLLDHQERLEPECLRALKIADAIEQCTPDYRRYCEGVPRGPQAFECLASRMDSLLPQCHRIVAANAPYMSYRDHRYGYGYSEPYPPRERYANGSRDGYPYPDNAYGAEPQDSGPVYGEQERFRPYGNGYAPRGYQQRDYNYSGPREPYEAEDDSGQAR